jgi:uncharacterized protein (TIGR02145 family)
MQPNGTIKQLAWCYYLNDTANGITYGKLYNRYAVLGIYDTSSLQNPSLRKKLAPAGFHVPSETEWSELTTCLGGDGLAGGKMKEVGFTHWMSPNTGATNSSGFTAFPGGSRLNNGFKWIGINGYWWSTNGVYRLISGGGDLAYSLAEGPVITSLSGNQNGFSVRCVKD